MEACSESCRRFGVGPVAELLIGNGELTEKFWQFNRILHLSIITWACSRNYLMNGESRCDRLFSQRPLKPSIPPHMLFLRCDIDISPSERWGLSPSLETRGTFGLVSGQASKCTMETRGCDFSRLHGIKRCNC